MEVWRSWMSAGVVGERGVSSEDEEEVSEEEVSEERRE